MKNIKTLNELRRLVEHAITNGFADIRRQYIERTGFVLGQRSYSNLRIVVVGSEDEVRCCARENKRDGEKEIMLLRKTDLLNKGLLPQQWDKLMERCSLWLEKRGCYKSPERYAIAGQQPLFPVEK